MHTLLEGVWRVNKRLDYAEPAGWRGSMEGIVRVSPRPTQPEVLMWEEQGTMHLDGNPEHAIPVRKALAFRCRQEWPVEVFFVEGNVKEASDSGWGVSDSQRLFFNLHPTDDGATSSFDHLCVKDLYTGTLHFTTKDSFDWCWKVVGPHKDGVIKQSFARSYESR